MINGITLGQITQSYTSRKSPAFEKSAQSSETKTFADSTVVKADNSQTDDTPYDGDLRCDAHTEDGDRVLYWGKDIIASVGGIGGAVNIKYHENSTEEDPIVVAWGTDAMGKEYSETIHLNDIDINHATPAEMIALNAHLSKTGHKDAVAAGPGALWNSLGLGNNANSKMNFEQYYKDYIAMQQLGNNKSGAALYQYELESYLFFCKQNEL